MLMFAFLICHHPKNSRRHFNENTWYEDILL